MVMMEGILWKWTNYLSVHNTDTLRIDLKVPPENYMYLRASTSAERQKWLVALGTAKACLVDVNYEEQRQHLNSMSYVKEKMKELNFCRNVMMEQIHEIKSCKTSSDSYQPLAEAVTLLSATCDTFSTNLNEVMEILEDNLSVASGSPVSTPRLTKPPAHKKRSHSTSAVTPTSPSTPSIADSLNDFQEKAESSSGYSLSHHSHHSHSSDKMLSENAQTVSANFVYPSKDLPLKDSISQQSLARPSHLSSSKTNSSVSSASSILSSPDNVKRQLNLDDNNPPNQMPASLEKKDVTGKSFFGLAPARFEDVHLNSAGLIPTKPFLDACFSIVPVFDSLGATTFAPVKMDIQGNIQKIRLKYDTDTSAFAYLQNMVFQEVKSNEHTARNSVTDALLWLKRALEFILVFLSEVSKGQRDLAAAAGTAYSKSLRQYHGWIVRGVFNLAVKACPYYKDFVKALATRDGSMPATEQEVLSEMTVCVEALNKIVNKLNSYYKKNKLDSDAVV